MREDYKTPLQIVVDSLKHYQRIEAAVEETDGLDFFPDNLIETHGDTTSYTLCVNPKVQVILTLYDLALSHGIDTGEAIVHYSLFHACLEMDDYVQARTYLEAFRRDLDRLHLSALSEDERKEVHAQVLLQLFFLFFHESFHLVFHHRPDDRQAAFDTTRQLLLDIKAEWEDGLSLVTEEELMNHPKTRQHTDGMIPEELPEAERQAMKDALRELLSQNPIRPAYIDQVLQGDKTLIEEITCDRQAWLNLLPVFQNDGATEQDILHIHLYMFTVFNAMDFNKFLLSQFVPSLHGQTEYDGMRVVLRHKAFKVLLRQYNPETYKLLKSEYLDLNTGLEAVYRSAVLAFQRDTDNLVRLYARHREGKLLLDFTQLVQLENEMTEAASVLP